MKDKILTLIIGILIGAIITSAGFVICLKTNKSNRKQDLGEPPKMNQSQSLDQNRGTPPDLPNGKKQSKNQDNSSANNNNQDSMNTQNNEQTQSNT